MRIIAGTRRSLPLKTVAGVETRPTTDRIKETLFNILQDRIYGSIFLDLFAGSGQIGLEALSRGASFACFVENGREQGRCIEENIRFTKFTEQSKLLNTDVIRGLHQLEGKRSFDLIFMDPPYGKGLETEALSAVKETGVLAEDGLIILEAPVDFETDFPGFTLTREKKYQTTQHIFLEAE